MIWIDPDDNEITDSDTSGYLVDQGNYDSGAKVSTLTIEQSKLATLATGSEYKCKVKSAFYPIHSPEVVKEMTLNFIGLSKFLLLFAHFFLVISSLYAHSSIVGIPG